MVPDDFEPFQGIWFVRGYAALLSGDPYLVRNGVDTVKIREQQAPLHPAADHDPVPFDIELVRGPYRLHVSEDVHAYLEGAELLRGDR